MRRHLLENETLRHIADQLPEPTRKLLRRLATTTPPPRWGNLRRRDPFDQRYGADRGTPIDRFYIERFLASHQRDIRGRVLEVRDSRYTDRFGGGNVDRADVLDIDPRNLEATIVADLAEHGSLPLAAFDCFILTQTLQYVSDPAAALRNALDALRPGGVILLSVPAITRTDAHHAAVDRWRLTPPGVRALLAHVAGESVAEVDGRGNLVTAIAFLLGLAAEDLRAAELDYVDSHYEIVTLARVAAPAAS